MFSSIHRISTLAFALILNVFGGEDSQSACDRGGGFQYACAASGQEPVRIENSPSQSMPENESTNQPATYPLKKNTVTKSGKMSKTVKTVFLPKSFISSSAVGGHFASLGSAALAPCAQGAEFLSKKTSPEAALEIFDNFV